MTVEDCIKGHYNELVKRRMNATIFFERKELTADDITKYSEACDELVNDINKTIDIIEFLGIPFSQQERDMGFDLSPKA